MRGLGEDAAALDDVVDVRDDDIGNAGLVGRAHPVGVYVETFGTEKVGIEEIEKRVRATFDMSPRGIIKHLDLLNVTYLPTASNGHFGNPAFPWERVAEAEALRG